MARKAGESSTKRAKVDEKEDPLVRRKEEARRRAKGKGNALLASCAKLEAKNEERLSHFRRLPAELWQKIVDENVHQNDMVALAMTCRFFREKQKEFEKKVETSLNEYDCRFLPSKSGKMPSHTLGWFRRVCNTFEILPGAKDRFGAKDALHQLGQLHQHHHLQDNLLNYAMFIGSVEIVRWLVKEKGWRLFFYGRTVWWAGLGGSVEVFEYLNVKGYQFTKEACEGAAMGGCLKALKFLRGLDPPCPWREMTCWAAAWEGHLHVLKWARAQNPPCPWNSRTCSTAAKGGHLDVLMWARAQNPPCPWNDSTCSEAARGGHLDVLKWARSQDPPCPWSREECRQTAFQLGHEHVVDGIDWID